MLIIYVACVLHMLTTVLSTPYRHKSTELIENELKKLDNFHGRQIRTNEENDDILLNNAQDRLSSYGVRRKLNRHGLNEMNDLQTNLHEGTQTDSKKLGIVERHEGHGKGKGRKRKGKGKGKERERKKEIPEDLEVYHEAMYIEKGGKVHEATGKDLGKKKATIEQNDRHLYSKDSRKRNYLIGEHHLWPEGIVPYVIDSAFNAEEKAKIIDAAAEFRSLTCVHWVPLEDSKDLGHTNYVSFVNGTGCSSYIGRVGDSNQNIVLSITAKCVKHSIIIHEMLHALGAKHEMARPDRDNYVQIMWDRLSMGEGNFVKSNMSKVSTTYPYDMSSVLHYALRSFTKNGMETIVVKDWRLKFLASVGNDLMYYDIAEVNSVYKCADNCPSLGCLNGGFTLWNCTCYCPDVLTGGICEQTISNNASCGGTINVPLGTEVTLTSPNYPNNYNTGLSCTWLIKGVENNILRGTIVDMEISNNDYACYHWMEIRYNMMGQKGPERCGSTNHEVWDTTADEEMNTMIIIFDSFVGSDKTPGRGFKMNFVSIGTGCLSNPCKFGSCDSPINTDSYVCTCDYGFKGINCTELSEYASIGCTAEVGEYCVFMQEPTTDQMNWDTSSKAPYIYSGPQMAKEGFIFLYLHSSGRTTSGDKAVMSTQIDFPKVERCLSFWYHMYSWTAADMGFMTVFVSNSEGQDVSVFLKNGTQGKYWLYQEIDIPAVDNLKVSFVGTRNKWQSYMAVDDIWLIPGTCGSPLTSTTTSSTTTQTTTTPTTTTPTTTMPTTTTPTTTTPTTTTPTTTTPTTTTPTTTTPTTTTPAPTTTTPAPTTTTPAPTSTTPTTTTPAPTTTTTTTTTPAPTTTTPTTTTPSTTTPTTTTPTTTTPAPTTTTPTTTTPTTTPTTTTTPTPTTPTATANPGVTSTSVSYSCGFESSEDDCIFENSNNGDFDWKLGHTGGTPTLGTGPANAYSGDQYAYIEVTKKRKNKVAILSTLNKVLDASNYCLQFHYHMRGAGSGTLSVSVQEYGYSSSWDNVFTANGNQGDRWMFASINIPYHTDLYIEITADKGGNKGDIAIDEIVLSTGECTNDLFVCGFELLDETCIFRNKGNDDFDWKLGQLNTPTLNTGPTDAYSGNQYAYIEVNKKESGAVAVLSTDGTVLAASKYCLQFYYHMYGAHIGNLVVYIKENGSEAWEIVFTKDKNQGKQWNHACLNLSYQNEITIEIEASKGGQTSKNNKGDISIDDIQLSTGACTCQYIDSHLK